jgi:ssDNA-binding Zn-finger/Zn-ribbon topoisomerase 1
VIYTCTKCRFTFSRAGKVEDCPDCGKQAVREATEKEKEEYKKNRAEYEAYEKSRKNK